MSDQDEDYEVGYGKPPTKTQFKKGQSGNPKGRPKEAKGVRASLKRELEAKITIRDNGRELRVSKAEALAKLLIATGMKGNLKAIFELLKLDSDLFAEASVDGEKSAASVMLEAVDYDILRDFFGNTAGEDLPKDREADDDGS